MKYRLKIVRTITTEGYVDVEAKSKTDAIRKYFKPKANEPLLFDDEINWDYSADNESWCYSASVMP